ncbi:MAG: 4Fe-4S ferredoxin [Deltaproteobacteria bacterium]|nr:4Fe-4S ferredoxin [Deltaproteobacteria bacterium]
MFKMTPQILRNLISGPATRAYPRQIRPPFPATRGRLVNDIAQCNFCGACAVKCPSVCIEVDRHLSRWSFAPHICVCCGVCVEICPRHCLRQEPATGPPAAQKEMVALDAKS